MFKKNFLTLLLILFFSNHAFSNEKVFIALYVDEKIITNIDIKKEADYLKILNPKLASVEIKKINDLAKKSLIKEIIKKNEIEKIFDLQQKNSIEDKLLNNLYSKLNLNSSEFENLLLIKNNYSIAEIKEKLKIEVFWNDLIYYKYNQQIKIDKEKLLEKIEDNKFNNKKEYFLYYIIFEKNKDQDLSSLINNINSSIAEIGFDNTANIYSISESSKFGGKIGWVNETNLSKIIIEKLKNLKKDEITKPIQIGNNYLILKINDIRETKVSIDKENELKKLIEYEQNKQLNQFSKIYFKKAAINYSINEK